MIEERRFQAIPGLAHDLQVGLELQAHAQAAADGGLIVDEQDAGLSHALQFVKQSWPSHPARDG